jgi:hypothetical protein
MHAAAGDVGATATAAAAAVAALSGEDRGDVANAAVPKMNAVRGDRVGAQRATRQHRVGRAGERFIVACISQRG